MPLKGRVGRHKNTGDQCQNWADDQKTVIDLLNKIPVSDGGAEGLIPAKVVGGISSDGLYSSILYFQKKHFPASVTGFIEPTGPMLAQLQSLAAKPSVPKPPGAWDNMLSGSVERALRKALSGDQSVSHPEAIEMIRETLTNGTVSENELKDITTVATNSRSLEARSRTMLHAYVAEVRKVTGGRGKFRIDTDKQQYAANMVCDFMKRIGRAHFPRLDRDEVGIGLLMRISNPAMLQQGEASLCGPTVLLFNVASNSPGQYAKFAIDLYEKGKSSIGRLEVKPRPDVRNHLPKAVDIAQCDWLTMASIRDSENWLLDYDEAGKQLAGITLPGELAHWFRLSGYSDVRQSANLAVDEDEANLAEADRLFGRGFSVCLFIGANMLYASKQGQGTATAEHWVVLRSPIDRTGGKVKLKVYTWGTGEYQVPQSGDLPVGAFLDNYYGYVAAKP